MAAFDGAKGWPALPLEPWRATRDTLHMWTQIVGKVRLGLAPRLNHWWQVPLYVSARGLTTSAILHGGRALEIRFDLCEHDLVVETSDGRRKAMPLVPRSVGSFYRELMAVLAALDVHVHVWTTPVEVPDPVPFDEDEEHASYDADAAHRFFLALVRADEALREFAAGFVGKQSPVQLFWGSFDLAYTRFSGRRAPERPGADRVTREAYSHEVMSFGFWPGGVTPARVSVAEPVFYAYAAPEPPGFREARVRPAEAYYHPALGEYVLPYEAVRASPFPADLVREFCDSVYEAGAALGGWDREALEARPPAGPGAEEHRPVHPG